MKELRSIHLLLICSLIIVGVFITSCSDDDDGSSRLQTEWTTYKLAVILPYGEGMQERWQRLSDWAASTIVSAQTGMEHGVKLELEWYDEEKVDIADCVSALANCEDVAAVIGPFYSAHTNIAAKLLYGKKPLLTTSSSADLVRKYSKNSTLWALTETDITQCEVLLSKALMYGARKVGMIASPDIYGQTFIDWFAFQACELGLEVGSVVEYDPSTLSADMNRLLADDCDIALCIPTSPEDAVQMAQIYRNHKGSTPRLLFSDVARSTKLLEAGSRNTEGLEGISIDANPESGFNVAYEVRFGEAPTTGEAQIMDALLLTAIAAYHKELHGAESLNQALREVVAGRDANVPPVWTSTALNLALTYIDMGLMPDITGASGSLDFDATVYTNVLYTTYAWWEVYEGKFITLDYNTSDGSKRTEANLAGWNWKNSQMQDIADGGSFGYPARKGNYALIVAGSNGWGNYRHQADALDIYQKLKASGYDDDHIVLVLADDIARNAKNPEPGIVRVRPDGENVYKGAQIDYRLADISPQDILSILCGERNERLPEVISATEQDNILVFWSGHGSPGQLVWGDYNGFYYRDMKELLQRLNAGGTRRYRKMLWLVEACYAGSVAVEEADYPGVLYMTASNAYETSKADIYNAGLGCYMSNRFTATLEDELTNDVTVSLRDLYYKLFRNTVGSHVTIYNEKNFDNLYKCTMEEFTVPAK